MVRRRNKPPEPENHERWLVSYADFITLLFAFFVVMFASSQADRHKAKQLSESVKKALEESTVQDAFSRLWKSDAKSHAQAVVPHELPLPSAQGLTPPSELMASFMQLQSSLSKQIGSGEVEVRMEGRGLIISLKQKAFFPSGTDAIEPATLPMLETIALELRGLPNSIRMEGHTDAIPIRTPRFRSNWDLSSARAIAVLDLFRTRFDLPASRMAVAGYAETIPIASNETEEGRGRNRRVDIAVLNESAAQSEPGQSER